MNERSILSVVDREAAQVGERRVAGAEVVEHAGARPSPEQVAQRRVRSAAESSSSRPSVSSSHSAVGRQRPCRRACA